MAIYQDILSINLRDNVTLKLHFEPRLIDLHVDQKALDKAMEEFKESAALTDDEADALNKKSAKMSAFLKSPERVAKIVEDIAKHFKEKVQPHELKGMIVFLIGKHVFNIKRN